MSFLKIRDPLKREQTVKEFLELKKKIHDDQLAEKTGKLKYQQQLSRFFRPVTETQKETLKGITEELKPIKKEIERFKTRVDEFPTLDVFESLKLNNEEEEKIADFFYLLDLRGLEDNISKLIINSFELSQLRRFKNKDEVDLTYGLYEKDKKLYIGNKKINIVNDSFYIDDYEYKGTPGLWELIVAKKPDRDMYTDEDLDDYKEIILKSNTLHRNDDPNNNFPKNTKKYKWKHILKNFWHEERGRTRLPLITSPIRENEERYHPYYYSSSSGKGIMVIPSDPNALLKRLDLLMASKGAGNTGVRNELVSICDELKRQRILDAKTYKKLMSIL